MEYLEGTSLAHILEHMPSLSFSTVLDLLIKVCRGLGYAHDQGIIHQDIKPANIFITEGNSPKVLDFGLAVRTGSIEEADMPGTPMYMAPEQITGDPVDERTDIYSLGITAFEMATGKRPFGDADVSRLLQAQLNDPVPDPRSLNPDLPEEFSNFIMRATRKDPSERYGSVTEILAELIDQADKIGVKREPEAREKRKMMSLFMFYGHEKQVELTRIVEEFGGKLSKLGVELRVADFEDL
jgi:serine/threonine protein kinase